MSQPEPGKRERRKAETRLALVGVAQTLITERRTSSSIREITDQAGLGFGTFFNYFTTKDELFDAAVRTAFVSCDTALVGRLDHLDDPAEVVAATCRLMVRLQRRVPGQIRVLLAQGSMLMVHQEGLAPRFRRCLVVGAERGRFDIDDFDRGLMAVLGAMLGVLQLLDLRPDLDDEVEADQFTVRVLLSLGMPREDAEEVVSRPLPSLPAPSSQVWEWAVAEAASDRAAPA